MKPSRVGLKWTYHGEGVLPAWVAEMDFGLAPAVSEALHNAVDLGLTGYPYPEAEWAAAVAATDFWASRFGWRVDPEWVHPAPDVIEGVRRAIQHLTRPGTPVVLHTPVYFPFFSMVERAGRQIVEVPGLRDGDGRFRLDLDGIDRALAAGAGSVVLCSPWNPTGRVFTPDELGDLLDIAKRHEARVIADEVHGPIVFPGSVHTPLATIDPARVVTVTSASKAWNLPGLKCAQVVLTNGVDREKWTAYFTPDKVGVGTFGLIANAAAYSSGGDWLASVLDRLQTNRDLLSRLITEHLPLAGYSPPQGTYLAWLDLSGYGVGDPAAFCLEEAGVALNGGGPFGGDAEQFVRFNFATGEDVIAAIVERMGQALGRAGTAL